MNHKNKLFEYVLEREKTFGLINRQRARMIKSYYEHGKDKLDLGVYGEFLSWLRDNREHINFALVWGSYVKGMNNDHSYSRVKKHEFSLGELKCGASDFDGLVITSRLIDKPSLLCEYDVIDKDLSSINSIKLDIYRDVFVVDESSVSDFFSTLKSAHLALYSYSCANDGIILRDKVSFSLFLECLGRQIDYEEVAASYFFGKYTFLRSFL